MEQSPIAVESVKNLQAGGQGSSRKHPGPETARKSAGSYYGVFAGQGT
jgi:hypothetical protein